MDGNALLSGWWVAAWAACWDVMQVLYNNKVDMNVPTLWNNEMNGMSGMNGS